MAFATKGERVNRRQWHRRNFNGNVAHRKAVGRKLQLPTNKAALRLKLDKAAAEYRNTSPKPVSD